MTVTLVYTEFVWWILALPMCIQRVVINLSEDRAASPTIEAGIEDAVARPKPLRPGAALGRSGVGR